MNADPRTQWLHDLRNALNAVSVGLTVSRRLMEDGDTERALGFLQRAETDCERTRKLMQDGRGD